MQQGRGIRGGERNDTGLAVSGVHTDADLILVAPESRVAAARVIKQGRAARQVRRGHWEVRGVHTDVDLIVMAQKARLLRRERQREEGGRRGAAGEVEE